MSYAPDMTRDKNTIEFHIQRVTSCEHKFLPIDESDFKHLPQIHLFYEFEDIVNFEPSLLLLENKITDVIICFSSYDEINLTEINRILRCLKEVYGENLNIIYGTHKLNNKSNSILDIFIF